MLNRVYHAIVRSQFCDPAAAAISMWFFVQLSEPYFQALTQWIYLGESTDEDVEFAHDGMFDTLDCLQHDEALIRAISETGALLRVTRTVQSHLYYLSSKYADDKMQALADSIFALQMSSSPVEKSMQSNAHEYTTRVTQKLGGSGAAASNAIYHGDELENSCSAPQVRLRQQPGGNSDGAETAIYGGKVDGNTEHKVVSSVRVMQEPGGSGSAVSSLLYPTDNEASADAHVTHIKVLQEPGGDGNSASDLLYGRTHEHEPARRPSVRVSHPPGGDSDALGDTLYAQFANLGVHSRPSVKVLAPSGGGIDSVSSLAFGVHADTPKKQVADPNNNMTIEWTVAQEGPSQPTRLLEQDVFAPTHLTSDYAHVLETYRQLMDNTMEYAPVETLVRVSMTGPVLNQRAFVGTVALNVLREHVHLMQHLGTLHDVMLLSGGLWVDRFMQEFILGLDTASRVNWGVPGALNDLLANALDEANFHVTESTALFAFRPTDELETNPTMAPSLDQVLLHIDPVYALPSVLVDVVVSKSTLQQYAVLHKHLFQLKAIALSLQSVRRILTAHPTVATRSGHVRAHVDHHLCTTLVAHSFQDAAAFKHLHDNYINAVSTSFQRREAVKADEELLAHIHFLWGLTGKDSTGRLHEYCVFLMDVRRHITIPDLNDAFYQATAAELQPLLKEVVPFRWRTNSGLPFLYVHGRWKVESRRAVVELKKLPPKTIDLSSNDADALLRNNRNGDWITGVTISQAEWKTLSFRAILCATHTQLFSSFSQKLHATTKGQLESEYRLHQAKQPMPRMLREPSKTSVLAAVAAAKPAASALHVPFMTDRIRPEVWDPEVANLLQNIAPRPGICVVGPPRSGKSRLAMALAKELGVIYFSIPLVLEIAAKTSPPAPDATDVTPRAALYATVREVLLSGRTVSREDAVAALLYHMVDSLEGFLVDDLYPHDAWGSDAFLGLHFTHVVCLTGSQANCAEHVASISLCPKRRLLYSARDLAQFTGVIGFADTYVEPAAAPVPPPAVVTPPTSDDDAENEDADEEDDETAKANTASPVDSLAPSRFPRLSLDHYAPYLLPVNQDRVLNIGNLWLQTFETEFSAYERSVAKTLATAPADTQVVRIAFHQSPLGILQQAVAALTGVEDA
ncbi:hypothetical protein DYB32_006317 [Aphanomyces invadans]|uniref:Gamma tubulin complex component C-terminal domain-containing protein n=1 Tax=Aphanomyces invadans TaxID=157072 RepID=A0A418AS61_9STRA|nr:hypothetical protein DYB32_006317 [Aphanomyces invadans]